MRRCDDNFIVSGTRLSISRARAPTIRPTAVTVKARRGARQLTCAGFDPFDGTGQAGVGTRLVSLSTTNTLAHHTKLLAIHIAHWTARVSLATVLASTGNSCTLLAHLMP
jgi:hypothetical protein